MKKTAKKYFSLGNNIVVLNREKEPLVKWAKWETERQTLEELESLPWDDRADLFAIICGRKLNNGLYVGAIDVDVKKVSEEALERGEKFEKLLKVVTQTEETPSLGKHFIYYSKKPIKTDNKAHEFSGIEVLGERKLCIMAPSKGYRRLNDNAPRIVESLNQFVDTNLKRLGYKMLRRPTERRSRRPSVLQKQKIRPCFIELMKKEHLTHLQKVALVTEFHHAGSTQAEIEILFTEHKSWEQDKYNPVKSRRQIDHIISKPYKRFSCELLDEEKVCTGPENCKRRERRKQDFFDEEGRFKPTLFAKQLLEDFHFKTTRDNETLYVFNWEKGVYGDFGEVFVKEQMVAQLDENTRARHFNDVDFYIKGSTYFDRANNPTNKIVVTNGILDVVTKELIPHTPELFVTTHIPITYDPSAKCPAILKFIEEVVGKNQVPIIQECFGYCLLKAMPFPQALMLIGFGRNGKSTLLNLLEKLLGEKNVSSLTLQSLCHNRFAAAQLYDKLANLCADIPKTTLTKTGTFKMLTGNDMITAEHKHKQLFGFRNHAKLIFSANQVPETKDDTLAYFSRWIIISCNNIFRGANCNPHILKEIATPEALSGLLNFALEGLDRLLKNGGFSTSETIEELRSHYMRKSNSAKAFIEEQLEYDPDGNLIPVSIMYERYIIFCQDNNLPSTQKRTFTINMQQLLPKVHKTQRRILHKSTWVWENVRSVTTVTTTLLKLRKTTKSNVNNKTEERKEKERLREEHVTAVTATTCPLCNGLLPRDQSNTTTWEGKLVHIKPCYVDLMAGRIKP